ncbi:MAG: hypothetical protein HY052_08800 [Proteobacteria bacterium]|nr:hypothetical protein [Pseudomonadota bacterium]
MNACSRIVFGLFLLCTVPAWAEDTSASLFYKYSNSDAEYTVMLPEAPTVSTIWGDDPKIPYLENLPQDGEAVGEIAVLQRSDPDTRDYFDAKITFLKADTNFLTGMTQEKMQATLERDFKGIMLEEKKLDFSTSANNDLKWATITGFSVGKNNRPLYNVEHYLTGQQSILVIRVQYSLENKLFADYYKTLNDSITYRPL